MSKKIKHLVVDTSAFIKAENLLDLAEEIITVQEVVDEIKNDRQRRRLVALPYELVIKDVFVENIKFVSEFAKKTGDYTSLSATDIKVMALAYQLEKEHNGSEHLKTEPAMQKTIKVYGISQPNNDNTDKSSPADSKEETLSTSIETDSKDESDKNECKNSSETNKSTSAENEEVSDDEDTEDLINKIQNMDLKTEEIDDMIVKISDEEEETSESDNDDSDGEWITPNNIKEKKKELEFGEFEDKAVTVACITSDFAMQNVLKQIGLYVTAIDGRVIKQLRTFIFRCTTCFKTTSVMTKLFCPKCGHATLKKVSVSIDDEGHQHIHINGRKPLNCKGKRFSLPTPKGGQHFQYPVLTEDQHIHKRFVTKQARKKTNALDDDYLAGFSPFAMRDVNSKSAVLGVRANKEDVKYWMKHYSKGKK